MGIFSNAITKSALKKAIKKQLITVNGIIASTATYINGGEIIQLSIPEKPSQKRELVLPLTVLYEDEYFAAIHKPAGILVSGNTFKTIAHALPQNIEPSKLSDATIPQPVHRLDYATTGILLAGKTNGSIRLLNKMFEEKAVVKTYYAIAIGQMPTQGNIMADIDGKKSQSDYKVQQTVSSKRFGCLNLVELKPKTGRRHQLRKHLASIGNPILGDKEYGTEGFILHKKGLYLHAYTLEFTHPFTQEKLYIKDELPKRFVKIFG